MDTKQRQLLEVSLQELCSIQDDITHMNENGLHGEEMQKLQSQRTRLIKGIIGTVDKWTTKKAA